MIEQLKHLNYWDEDSDEFVDHWIVRNMMIIVKYPIVKNRNIPNSVTFKIFPM